MKIFFKDIFLLDSWGNEEAINYLAGIYDVTEFCDDTGRLYVHVDTLDFESYSNQDEFSPDVKSYLKNAERYKKIWESGHHAKINPPNYYIDWAISKKFEIPWLDDAIEHGYYKPKEIYLQQNISKPLSDKERITLLVIIAALAKEAKVDISKISKSGDLIASMTQIIGAPIGATTIETHLRQIPEALQSRTK
jgi:hypothetical protein